MEIVKDILLKLLVTGLVIILFGTTCICLLASVIMADMYISIGATPNTNYFILLVATIVLLALSIIVILKLNDYATELWGKLCIKIWNQYKTTKAYGTIQ